MGYYVTSGICLFFLVMIPIWTARPDSPTYPFVVILLLAAVVMVVPMMFRTTSPKRRKGD